MSGEISKFITTHYRHFNAATLVDAAKGYRQLIDQGGAMFMTLAGAMSTAELGVSLAEMIRQGKISGISCTGANLEEDVYNLVAHDSYRRVPHWREMRAEDELALLKEHLNRVTDTCIPEEAAIRRIEAALMNEWQKAQSSGESYLPHEYFYKILQSKVLEGQFQIPAKDSWLLAAAEVNLPLFVPGWEDSTCGNIFAARCIEGKLSTSVVKSGIHYMIKLADFYQERAARTLGFFQIGGGIAGDFPICVAPMLTQDLLREIPRWGYFCQISEATTSYGGYSGATPNEKITWGKLDVDTPRFLIESDATIVAPLIFAYVLGW